MPQANDAHDLRNDFCASVLNISNRTLFFIHSILFQKRICKTFDNFPPMYYNKSRSEVGQPRMEAERLQMRKVRAP